MGGYLSRNRRRSQEESKQEENRENVEESPRSELKPDRENE